MGGSPLLLTMATACFVGGTNERTLFLWSSKVTDYISKSKKPIGNVTSLVINTPFETKQAEGGLSLLAYMATTQ